MSEQDPERQDPRCLDHERTVGLVPYADELRGRVLIGTTAWTSVDVVDEIGSTNAELVQRARDGVVRGAVLIADHQTGGRGRLARTWAAAPGTSLAVSVLLRPERSDGWSWLPLLAGIAVADAAVALGVGATLKWPNDVLAGDAKVAGILAESVDTSQGQAVVIGCGINTTAHADELPVATATSLALAGAEVSPVDVAAEVLLRLDRMIALWEIGEDDLMVDMYTNRCATIGQQVRVELAEGTLEGQAVRIDSDGGLVVQTGTAEATVVAGDVVHLRRS